MGVKKSRASRSIPLAGTLLIAALFGWQASIQAQTQRSSMAMRSQAQAPMPSTTPTSTVVAGQTVMAQPFTCQLIDERGQAIRPSALARGNNQVFLLGPDCLYVASQNLPAPAKGGVLNVTTYNKPTFSLKPGVPGALNIPVHEFVNLVYSPLRKSVFVLDKSGDIFEFDPQKNAWGILRANLPSGGSPDPEYIDLCLSPSLKPQPQVAGQTAPTVVLDRLNLLDPERNQIWKLALPQSGRPQPYMKKSFPEIMPWRVGPGQPSVAESVALTYDSLYYVLRNFSQSGQIGLIQPLSENTVRQGRLPIKGMRGIRPTRMVSQPGLPLYIVERENNRILAVDKNSGNTRPFLFTGQSDLRGVSPAAGGFWVIDGNRLVYRQLAKPDTFTLANKPPVRTIDNRLKILHMPIVGMTLPRHAGVYPGARRLYRYGVHEGMDFFYGGGTAKIYMGSPAVAAGDGKVIRADADFTDMNLATYNRVMSDCVREHQTSDKNEDLLRGCQVWIDHGNGLITRYAHLDKINSKIKVGQTVKHGDLIGFVGVSGTGQNLPGRTKYPHLHFEIWLDGKYLGYGLTPAETVGIFENIFGNAH